MRLRVLCLPLLALTLVLGGVNSARADIAQLGPNSYVVGVPTREFVRFAAPQTVGRQQMNNWCWAACIQMVLNYHGLYVTQDEIVRRVFGRVVDRPATGSQIIEALSGWAPDMRGRDSEIYADPYDINPATVVNDLKYRWPLIVGLTGHPGVEEGHAYVLTGAYFSLDPNGRPIIHRVILRNPWPTMPSREVMPMREFLSRLEFATRVWVKRL